MLYYNMHSYIFTFYFLHCINYKKHWRLQPPGVKQFSVLAGMIHRTYFYFTVLSVTIIWLMFQPFAFHLLVLSRLHRSSQTNTGLLRCCMVNIIKTLT